MLVCGALGALIERVAYRPLRLRGAGRLAPLITAIGVSLLLENAGQLVFGADPKFFPPLVESRELVRVGGVAVSNIQAVVLGDGRRADGGPRVRGDAHALRPRDARGLLRRARRRR